MPAAHAPQSGPSAVLLLNLDEQIDKWPAVFGQLSWASRAVNGRRKYRRLVRAVPQDGHGPVGERVGPALNLVRVEAGVSQDLQFAAHLGQAPYLLPRQPRGVTHEDYLVRRRERGAP